MSVISAMNIAVANIVKELFESKSQLMGINDENKKGCCKYCQRTF